MKTYLDCYACFLRHALEVARIAGKDEAYQKRILGDVMDILKGMDLEASPPTQAQVIHRHIRRAMGTRDPYRQKKSEQNRQVLELEPMLRERIARSDDPLEEAVKLAAACNAIDLGPMRDWDQLEELFEQFVDPRMGRFDMGVFREQIRDAGNLLYIGDNAGEIVADKILLSYLKKENDASLTFAVRGGPILNDATLEDARAVGIDQWARVITTGSDCPGIIFSDCSAEFLEAFEGADLVLAKGQGNYESLDTVGAEIFFLLQVKCPIVARDMGVELGRIIFCQKTDEPRREGQVR